MFYTTVYCLELFYLFNHFSFNLLIKYSTTITYIAMLLCSTYFNLIFNNEIQKICGNLLKNCWSFDVIETKNKEKLLKKCRIINIAILISLIIVLSTIFIHLPIFGSQNDLFMCIQVVQYYFHQWYFLFYYLYFITLTFLVFSLMKLLFLFLYIGLNLQLQYSLMNEYLVQNFVYHKESWTILDNTQYQKEIKKVLCACIDQHIALKSSYQHMLKVVIKLMPLLVVLGILMISSSFFYIIYFTDTISDILKIRLLFFVASCFSMFIIVTWNGQEIIDATSSMFQTLVSAPFYFWNNKNCKTLLIFVINCTKSEAITYLGVCLDFKLLVSVMQTSVSYALIFVQLGQANGIY